ncbi:hypothetical protein LSH36_281g08019 [Paralvinella palmiformis]|uniref:C2H2-type domain-containing protein n=1 Tax=Paralvinella palmiformis TaxID=53620 RepID=A0AAD9N1Q9_9ANNE|nr:hypothetical protein LSH36_281g08019 [Paralvinella palmiformis]
MNHLCPPQMLVSSAGTQLLQASAAAVQMQGIPSSGQSTLPSQNTTVVPAIPGVMSSVQMPMGAIAIPTGATLQAVAVQAATMAIRQAAPIVPASLMTSMDQPHVSINCPTPINFHILNESKDGTASNNMANIITTMAQNLTTGQQQSLINASLAHVTQQVQHQAHLQQQQNQSQVQQNQQQLQQNQQQNQQQQSSQTSQASITMSEQSAISSEQKMLQSGPTTVSTLGLGLMTQDGLTLQQPIQSQLLIAPTSMSAGQMPVAMTIGNTAPMAPKKKKKKKKKNKVPTSLTPSSSSIPDKMVTYKPNCGDSDMEAFMAYQRLCNTHLDLKAKLHLLYNSRHSCQLCHREFKGFCRLRRHLQSHADFRPYKCENCSKRFYNVSKLKRHSLVHSGLKPYKCPLCDSALSRREHLKRHMLTHSEERPYRCSNCDYSSRRLDGVHKHIKGKHSGEDAKVMYVRPQIFDLLSHDFITQNVKGSSGESKEGQSSPIKDPLTDKDSFLQLMMGNIKFSQLFTTGTTAASNAPKPPTTEGSAKKKKKKKRKPSNPVKIKNKMAEETKTEGTKYGDSSVTLPISMTPMVSVGNGVADSQRMIFQSRSQSQTPVAESQNATIMSANSDQMHHSNTPTPLAMMHGQTPQHGSGDVILVSSQNSQQMAQQHVMTLANMGSIKQESATPQPSDISSSSNGNGTTHPAPQASPMPQQFNNFSAQLLPQGQQFFPAHLSEQVQVSMQNSIPMANAGSAFQSVYAGGTYEPVPAQMVPGKYFGSHNTMYEPDPFNGVPPGVAGIPPFLRRRIGQGCRQLNDMATFHLKQKSNFGGPQ